MKGFHFKPQIINDLRHYSKELFAADAMAGVIVGIVALPLAIAFGIASGVTPEKGIITAIVAGLLISLFGGSKVQIGGPTGAFIVIIYGIIQQYGEVGLAIATLMAGLFLVLLGVFRLGTIIKYIPYPIIIGFTAGIAVTIFTTQIGDILGLKEMAMNADGTPLLNAAGEVIMKPVKTPGDFLGKWNVYFQHMDSINWWNFGTAIASILIIIGSPLVVKKVPGLNKIPGSLYSIIVMTLVVLVLKNQGIDGIDTIGDRFKIKSELPDLVVPPLDFNTINNLISPAITIAVLGAIESLLSATVADGVIGAKHDSNQELIGQGIANIISPIFGGIPATGAIARTMTNINNGGKTPVAGIIHAAILLLIFLFLMPLAQYIPMSCLAGVLVIVSYNMSGWRTFRELMHNPKSDVSVLLITFFLTVIFDLTIAIEVGLMLACLLCMRRMAETTQVNVITDEIDGNEESDVQLHTEEHLVIPEGVEVYEINGPYFFGIANKFEEVMANMGERPKARIIRMRKVPFIDSTGLHNLTSLIKISQSEGIQMILSGVNDKVREALNKGGYDKLIGEEFICSNINEALETANRYLTK
jgi:SulP family sulfate permease